ncbi:uncharacterized threonine-rich GPI-anchored glycoprotein PJ4664.02-like isoform X1 [Xenia sp. Carnegie-2017]|uniref:uncharacterized threonine-rich GPI-anchored glycoprotein PJ4664.02-like isoform X1 n=1 Tax=Xenia sp. Carnegie-2017 TaxID=2897299 RepID=UPI001F04EAEE|nr:uncharacterized threonine-rich GPI-anchored glycoprotein PJ4664.02-like isoform X1 [Xenia sp. Carnegie-2017]
MYSLQFIILNIIFELMSIVPRVVCTSTVTLPTASFTHLKSSLSSIISSPPSNTFDHQQSTSLNYTTNLSSSKLAIPFPTLVVSSIVVSDYVTVSPNQVYGVNQSLILAMASSQTHTTIQSNFSKHSINSSSNYTVNTTKKVMVPANKSFSSHSSQRMTSSVSNLFSSSFKVTPTSTLVNISKFTSMSQNKSMMLMSTPTILMNTSTTNNSQMSIMATNQSSAKSMMLTSTPMMLTSTPTILMNTSTTNNSQMSITATNQSSAKSMMLTSTPTILMNTSTINNSQMSIAATNQSSAKSTVVTSTPTILTSTPTILTSTPTILTSKSRPTDYSQMSFSMTINQSSVKSMMLMSTPTILMNTSTTNNRQMSITATNQYSAKSIVVTSTPTILTSTSRPSNYSQMSISVTNNPPTKGGENKLLIIGLAVGLPLGIVLIIVVIVFYRKKRASNQYNIFYDEQNIVMHPFDYSK